jgi:hypothetical protein
MNEQSGWEHALDIAATVLLAVATVSTAWAAYQSRQWTGEQAQGYSRATATRITENRTAALANRQVQIDVATFIQWVDAHEQHRTALASFYQARFRKEFESAFTVWLTTKPFSDRRAPKTPFDMPQYRLRTQELADRLESVAASYSERAKDANQHADDYMLAVVLFACSLFFAGISLRLHGRTASLILVGLGWVVFVGTLVWVGTLPVQMTL